MAAASPPPFLLEKGSASCATRTLKPLSSRCRATTKPSPPLLPGPQSTVTVQGLKRATMASATARPAFSIRMSDGMPCATAKASAAAISVVVRISWLMPATLAHPVMIAIKFLGEAQAFVKPDRRMIGGEHRQAGAFGPVPRRPPHQGRQIGVRMPLSPRRRIGGDPLQADQPVMDCAIGGRNDTAGFVAPRGKGHRQGHQRQQPPPRIAL